eukprot:TRINITY_DN4329_c1_g2_i1.p1 TRINITY_DN4329_c1_g2~~TRINITY_DN4329_c1_g2_i1.p1  ORF type:complete len:564 (+),score=126.08 TRINITY_DN4329_c1_g2_i1:249-1694(+)
MANTFYMQALTKALALPPTAVAIDFVESAVRRMVTNLRNRPQEAVALLVHVVSTHPTIPLLHDLAIFYTNTPATFNFAVGLAVLQTLEPALLVWDGDLATKRLYLNHLATMYACLARHTAGASVLRKGLQFATNDAERLEILADLSVNDHDLWLQYASLLQSIGNQAAYVEALATAAKLLYGKGHEARALTVIQQARDVSAGNVALMVQHGQLLLMSEQSAEAAQVFREAVTALRLSQSLAVPGSDSDSSSLRDAELWLSSALLHEAGQLDPAAKLVTYRHPMFMRLDLIVAQCVENPVFSTPIEGHTHMTDTEFKVKAHTELVHNTLLVKTVCEVGFNVGHSTVIWLENNPNVHVYSFDFCSNPCSEDTIAFLQRKYNNRLTLMCGDSRVTIPQFAREHPDVKCDLIHVDGGHTGDVPLADLRNMRVLANPSYHVLAMDDVNCDAEFCDAPVTAWRQVIADGIVEESVCERHPHVPGLGS